MARPLERGKMLGPQKILKRLRVSSQTNQKIVPNQPMRKKVFRSVRLGNL